MAFKEKTDLLGLADATLEAISTDEGKSSSTVEVVGQNGGIVLVESFGEKISPKTDYVVKDNVTWAASSKSLGTVNGTTTKVCLSNISISTSAGSAPSVSASGEQVNADASTGCVFAIPALALKKVHHAQLLFGIGTFSGEGVHLTAANYTISSNVSTATKDGTVLSFDVTNGKIEAALTFRKIGSASPSLSLGEGWVLTGPMTESNPDSDYPTVTCTATLALTKTDAA